MTNGSTLRRPLASTILSGFGGTAAGVNIGGTLGTPKPGTA